MRFKPKQALALSTLVPLLALAGCRSAGIETGRDLDAAGGAVVSVEPLASAIGARALAQGGSAVDAAIATAFALAVTWPEAGNLGGGGFMLIRARGGRALFIDYREKAPRVAQAGMFLGQDGKVDKNAVRLGYRCAGVPGTVAGLWLAHQLHGELDWAELVLPAAELAEDGFEVSAALADSIARHARELALCEETRRIFLAPDGLPLRTGDWLCQPDLAQSLRLIARGGRHAFYEGELARKIVAGVRGQGGVLSLEDFRRYEAVLREPLVGSYRGCCILAGPPPTSGGQVLIQCLNQLEGFDLPALPAGDPAELHLLAEALKRSFLDRALALGDPDFVSNPLGALLDKEYARRLGASIDPAAATSSDRLAGDLGGTLLPAEGEHTTHISAVDRHGCAVANTYTLEESWGAKVVAAGTGILLNNEMADFNPRPGRSDRDGQIGTRPNVIEPEKRMLSSMCPVIVERNGEVLLVAGSPGGRTIPATVLRVVTGMIDHGLSPAEAVALVRIHHGLYPDRLRIEKAAPAEVRKRLVDMGHALEERDYLGDCHVIGRDPSTGMLRAVADQRRQGAASAPWHP
ncbi:MAG: gamma-glutamyltransferase [Planctomycetes bacterium]|nr:gamma-glutamyltransferase [Planctomycetota bacterium]